MLPAQGCGDKTSQAQIPRDYGFELLKVDSEDLSWNRRSLYNDHLSMGDGYFWVMADILKSDHP